MIAIFRWFRHSLMAQNRYSRHLLVCGRGNHPQRSGGFPRNQEFCAVLNLRVNWKTIMIQKCRNLPEATDRPGARVASELGRLKT